MAIHHTEVRFVTGMDGLMDFKGDLYSFNSNGSDGAENAFDDTNPAAAKEPIPAVLRNALRFALFMAYLSG